MPAHPREQRQRKQKQIHNATKNSHSEFNKLPWYRICSYIPNPSFGTLSRPKNFRKPCRTNQLEVHCFFFFYFFLSLSSMKQQQNSKHAMFYMPNLANFSTILLFWQWGVGYVVDGSSYAS